MRVQRAVLRLTCGCGREWWRHKRRGVLKHGSAGRGYPVVECPLRVLLVDRNVERGTVRVTFEMPLKEPLR